MKKESRSKLTGLLRENPILAKRVKALTSFASQINASEYHVTNACNIRCEGCWFFEKGHDQMTKEETDLLKLEAFLDNEVMERKINNALLIGGEPTLFPKRVEKFLERFKYITLSSNGLKKVSVAGMENVAIAITLFGAGPIDDQLRAIKPNGKRFSGLLTTALGHYYQDSRAGFVMALSEGSEQYLDETVKRIADNGNRVVFNFYSQFGTDDPTHLPKKERILEAALAVKQRYPDAVISHPYYIKTMIEGRTSWGEFGYDTCPSISVDYAGHTNRLANGNRYLPKFNAWAADLSTVKFCCTSGDCSSCRDSQAMSSWLLVSMEHFLDSAESLKTWVELCESYWSQFIWSPFHPDNLSSETKKAQYVPLVDLEPV